MKRKERCQLRSIIRELKAQDRVIAHLHAAISSLGAVSLNAVQTVQFGEAFICDAEIPASALAMSDKKPAVSSAGYYPKVHTLSMGPRSGKTSTAVAMVAGFLARGTSAYLVVPCEADALHVRQRYAASLAPEFIISTGQLLQISANILVVDDAPLCNIALENSFGCSLETALSKCIPRSTLLFNINNNKIVRAYLFE